MTVFSQARIAAFARQKGCSFGEAAAELGRRGARRRGARSREERELTRLRATWAWRKDFE